jgi:hypothetical protein
MLSPHVNPYYFFIFEKFIKTWVKNLLATKTFKEPNTNRVGGEIDTDNSGRSRLKINKKGTRDPTRPNKEQILDKKGWRERIQTSI